MTSTSLPKRETPRLAISRCSCASDDLAEFGAELADRRAQAVGVAAALQRLEPLPQCACRAHAAGRPSLRVVPGPLPLSRTTIVTCCAVMVSAIAHRELCRDPTRVCVRSR